MAAGLRALPGFWLGGGALAGVAPPPAGDAAQVGVRTLLGFWFGGSGALAPGTTPLVGFRALPGFWLAGVAPAPGISLQATQAGQQLAATTATLVQAAAALAQAGQGVTALAGAVTTLLELAHTQAGQFVTAQLRPLAGVAAAAQLTQSDQALAAYVNQGVDLVWAQPTPVDLVWATPDP